ncbi:class I SAM-dependent methyltransferase [Pontibacillus yanchengensis]|uniref:rRNA methyltransferase n=1 Tax=Pontibacillus yanchengensis Y32 TaxID=1385514 RepID=A0A0A2T5D0_9BACI|nr:class I SAM-dependent methyltransferase [Pontibacillus yanchengensis]KGP70992.1 rRNA methyltransferase [Pontibacillus yanchengensis Y32]
MLQRILDYAHFLLEDSVHPGDVVLDGTAGNGHDTLFLSQLVGNNGEVLSFDIQEQAILSTEQKINENNVKNITLIQDSHDKLKNYIPEPSTRLGGAIFNLGYLPGSDKSVVTKPDTTLTAIQDTLDLLKPQGLLVLVVYHGHPGGQDEKEALLKYLSKLEQKEYSVLRYGFVNQANNPPFILAIEKK